MNDNNYKTPLVSVVMPVYNAEKYVTEAIESILCQTFNDFEFIIIDDGSSDRSIEIVKGYNDSRIRFSQHEKNVNLVGTLNEGIGLSRGKYIARMDADDISHPERLEKQVAFMEANPDVGAIGCWAITINHPEWESMKFYATDEEIQIHMVEQIPFAHPTVMMRKTTLETHNLKYDQEYLEDYRLWFELSKVTQLANIPEYLLTYRFHEKQFTKRFLKFQREYSDGLRKEIVERWTGRTISNEDSDLVSRILRYYECAEEVPIHAICALLSEVYEGMILLPNVTAATAKEYLIHHAYRVCKAHHFEGLKSFACFIRLSFVNFWSIRHQMIIFKLSLKLMLKQK